MWPQERQAGHQTIHTNPMQWNFSGMDGVSSPGLQGRWKYAQKAALSILRNTPTAGHEWTPSFHVF